MDLQLAEELHGMGAHRLGLAGIDAVAPRRGQHALPSLVLELAMGFGAGILLGQHLRQNAVAQAERRIAEARQPEGLENFGIDLRAGDDDLGAPRPDAGHRLALGERHFGEFGGQLAHRSRGHHAGKNGGAILCMSRARRQIWRRSCRLLLAVSGARCAGIGKRRGGAGSSDHQRSLPAGPG